MKALKVLSKIWLYSLSAAAVVGFTLLIARTIMAEPVAAFIIVFVLITAAAVCIVVLDNE